MDDATWFRVQKLLQKNTPWQVGHALDNPKFPLRRFVRCANSDSPLTGGWSRGKGGARYGYYSIKKGGCRVRREKLHEEFLKLLRKLRPTPELLKLWRETVLDVWRDRHEGIVRQEKALRNRVDELKSNKKRLTEAFIYSQTVDRDTYDEMHAALSRDLAGVEMDRHDSHIEEIDVDGALDFAVAILDRADRLWLEADLEQRLRFQSVVFPQGLLYRKSEGFRTPVTLSLFSTLGAVQEADSNLVPLKVESWNTLTADLKTILALRAALKDE